MAKGSEPSENAEPCSSKGDIEEAISVEALEEMAEAELRRCIGNPVLDYCNVHGRHPFIDLLCILL